MARRVRRTSGPLDLRSQAILRAVIEEYISSATPVASQTLVDRYGLGVSSATVRNILAELETAGLLTHPHTSAGRIPTDAGYRWYVEAAVDSRPPAGRRAAHDPPPVRAGRVRERALVPTRRLDARLGHPLGRPRDSRQGQGPPVSAGSTSWRSRIGSRASSWSCARGRSSSSLSPSMSRSTRTA